MSDPLSPLPAAPDTSRLGAGFGYGLLVLFGGWIALGMLMSLVMSTRASSDNVLFWRLATIFGAIPLLTCLAMLAIAFANGRRRFGIGVTISVLAVPAVCLAIVLLFGLMH